jgi:O-acetyl-ADP-ribose deacetylase
MEVLINGNKLIIMIGDITNQETDAIVNAANGSLLGGGGVDGAIHRKAGKELLQECRHIREQVLNGKLLATGEAVITKGYQLPAKYVIHTVGPIWSGNMEQREEELLYNCYQHSLKLALLNEIKSISFPSISTGVYSFPIKLASKIALRAIIDFLNSHQFGEVTMTLFSHNDYLVYEDSLKKLIY